MHPVIGGALLQGAGGDDRPDSLAEVTAARATRALGHMPIHHNETHGLFGGVVGRLDFRRSNEPKVSLSVVMKAQDQILDQAVDFAVRIATGMKRRFQRGIPDFGFRGGQSPIKSFWVWLLFGNELPPRFRLIEPLLIFVNMIAPVLLEVV